MSPLQGQTPPGRDGTQRWASVAPATSEEATLTHRVLTALGGAALGAGLGFFASHVRTGDWDETPDREVNRPVWAWVGGSVGLAVGFSFPLTGKQRRGPETILVDRDRILGDEVRKLTSVTNAYDAVRLLRPEWLVLRGTASWRETARGSMEGLGTTFTSTVDLDAKASTLRAYVDETPLGSVEELRQLTTESIRWIRFIDPIAATHRWGPGHVHGAILVETW